jgi:hypothetical protein
MMDVVISHYACDANDVIIKSCGHWVSRHEFCDFLVRLSQNKVGASNNANDPTIGDDGKPLVTGFCDKS